MLEAMQEGRVTVLGDSHPLPEPFFVLATQNPIELEGTYPLPEAQLDRFLFKIEVPAVGEEVLTAIVRNRRRGQAPAPGRALSEDELRELFAIVDEVFLPEPVARYAARLVTATHPARPGAPAEVRSFVKHGASPRAAIALCESGRAAALLEARPNVDFRDLQRVARPAIAHRIVLDHAARLEGVSAADVVAALVAAVDPLGKALPQGRS
jgi:MoxR-like ATPase